MARQRCLAHRQRNPAAKLPEDLWPAFEARVPASYQAPSRAGARERPTAVACFLDECEASIALPMRPVDHHRAVRIASFLERLFLEDRRRLKIVLNAFGEKDVLKLIFAVVGRAADRWRAIKVTEFERHYLAAVRKQLDELYEVEKGVKITPASEAFPSK